MTVTMRDGSTVENALLGRLVQHDDRNRQFLIAPILEAEAVKPRSYTWRVETAGDQGREGACVGFAMTHELVARPKVYDLMEGTRHIHPELAVRNYAQLVYWDAQKIDPWPGGEYPGAEPIMAGTSVLCGIKILQRRGTIGAYRWAYNVDDLGRAIGHAGPAIIGVNWYSGMFSPAADGFIRPTGSVMGGHAILVHGVNWRGEYFKLTNSWGRGWGFNGECKVSFDSMALLLRQDGEACIPDKRVFQRDAEEV